MQIRISKIEINAFRGITRLDLPIEGKNVIIYGENGTGKSSIIDAIDFFFRGKIRTLEGSRDLHFREHGPHINYSLNDLYVKITFSPHNITLFRSHTERDNPPDILSNYFNDASDGDFILRRSQILGFINCIPSDRYREISNLIGLSSFDKIELELKRVYQHFNDRYEEEKKALYNIFKEISTYIKSSVSTTDEIFSNISRICSKTLEEEIKITSMDDLKQIIKVIPEQYKITNEGKIKVLHNISLECDTIIKNQTLNEVDALIQEFSTLKNKISLEDNERQKYVDLLINGKQIITAKLRNTCPLCEQNINKTVLIKRIDERLQELKELSEIASKKHVIKRDILTRIKQYESKIANLVPMLENIINPIELEKRCSDLRKKIARFETNEDIETLLEIMKENHTIKKAIQKIKSTIESHIKKIERNVKHQSIFQLFSLLEIVIEKINYIHELSKRLEKLKILKDVSETIYFTFIDIRKKETQKIFNKLENDIQNFFSRIHPNDQIEHIKLEIDPERRASLKLITKFYNKQSDPRALLSEGHLDSLGLCIFLAFTKRFNSNCPLIILDDVVSTIDSGHRSKIIPVLFEEFPNHQIILTTHDALWFEEIKAYQRAKRQEHLFVNYSIDGWDINNGIQVNKSKHHWEIIQDRLRNGDKNAAANECRSYLEYLLKEIGVLLHAKVVLKKNSRYTINDLFHPVKEKLLEISRSNEDFSQKVESVFRKLEETTFISNLLSHDNPQARNLSIKEVSEFCNSVKNLEELLTCSNCGRKLVYTSGRLLCNNKNCSKTST